MAAVQDYIWEQGEDLVIEIVYKINDVNVDLSNHAVRMDIAPMVGGTTQTPVFSFNSDDFVHDLDTAGAADNEVVLDANGNIRIVIPRTLTLPGGVIGNALATTTDYGYDLFLRDKGLNTQKKLLQGKITVRRSITQWA